MKPLIRLKVEKDGCPIMDAKTNDLDDLDDIFKTMKKKLK